MKRKTPEGYVLQAVMDYLAAKRVYCIRMNSGMLRNPAGRPVAFGEPGMADLLAFPIREISGVLRPVYVPWPTWLECKAPNGKQSELQKSFQDKVESEGHRYLVVRDISDLEQAGI